MAISLNSDLLLRLPRREAPRNDKLKKPINQNLKSRKIPKKAINSLFYIIRKKFYVNFYLKPFTIEALSDILFS